LTILRKQQGLLFLLRGFSILTGAAALLCGAWALHREVWALTAPRETPFPPQFRAQLHAVMERLPPGAFVLHLSAAPEHWYSRLWQRALYPRNDTIVMEPPLSLERLVEIRAKYAARFAISAGNPPYDPSYLWKIRLGQLPGVPGESWFGELGP
jgi:hypothetical protein